MRFRLLFADNDGSRLGLKHGELLWGVTVVITSILFVNLYLSSFNWADPRFGLVVMLEGTAHKPFVYRVLMGMLINASFNLGVFSKYGQLYGWASS